MLDKPHITQTTTRLTAVIHLTIPKDEIRNVMEPGLGELMATIAAQGIKPTGPWFDHHFTIAPDHWDFEIGVPVSAPVVPAGRVKPSQWPGMKVAKTVLHGDYEGLAGAWGEFLDWIDSSGYTPAADQYQCFVTGPESSRDPTKWRTELIKPLTS
jgi:effector-binding domain-containing protein